MFMIRDGEGNIYSEVENPSVVLDKKTGTLLAIGDTSHIKDYQHLIKEKYISKGWMELANDIDTMQLPSDQEEIDKAFNNLGYLKKLYNKSIQVEGVS